MDMFIVWLWWFLNVNICQNLSNYILNMGNLYINYITINLLKNQAIRASNFCKQKVDWERYIVPRTVYSLNDFFRCRQGGCSKKNFQMEKQRLLRTVDREDSESRTGGWPRCCPTHTSPCQLGGLHIACPEDFRTSEDQWLWCMFHFSLSKWGVFTVPLFINILSSRVGVWRWLGYLVQSSPVLMEILIYILDSEMEAAPE